MYREKFAHNRFHYIKGKFAGAKLSSRISVKTENQTLHRILNTPKKKYTQNILYEKYPKITKKYPKILAVAVSSPLLQSFTRNCGPKMLLVLINLMCFATAAVLKILLPAPPTPRTLSTLYSCYSCFWCSELFAISFISCCTLFFSKQTTDCFKSPLKFTLENNWNIHTWALFCVSLLLRCQIWKWNKSIKQISIFLMLVRVYLRLNTDRKFFERF